MPDYNFLNLSPPEFEELSRDLLQKHLGIFMESFTAGKDNGIDLRYVSKRKETYIIQCKRYKDFSSLFSKLKDEINSAKALNSTRYILVTSVGLTPRQKDEIKTLFEPCIKNTADIYGRDDLNNLLGWYPEIEKDHFKLYLSSVNVLEKILHSKIINQSAFEEEKIKDSLRVYVENKSFTDALQIIKAKKYVIISGMPGIGKTTLAGILAYHYLAHGFEQFVFLSDSISEGYEAFQDGISQVFLFDDFLGRNFLDKQLTNNEEQRIVRFIEKINKSPDKILIMTTREYILAQAKNRYDIFDNPSLDFAKCVIDLSVYTKLVRAKILYNHLFFSNIDEAHLANLLQNKSYNKIISHPNYSPRVIETIMKPEMWQSIEAKDFSARFLSFLDYPESIWKHSFENQISKLSQCILANLLTAGAPISLPDLKSLIQNFAKINKAKYGISYSDLDFKKAIKELENSFLISKRDSFNDLVMDYINPSVQDFLVNYFKETPDFLEDVLRAAIYFNQYTKVLSYEISEEKPNKINVSEPLCKTIVERIVSSFDDLSNSAVVPAHYNKDRFRWLERYMSVYTKLTFLKDHFSSLKYPALDKLIRETFQKAIKPVRIQDDDFRQYTDLFEAYGHHLEYDPVIILRNYSNSIYYLYQLTDFERLGALMGSAYDDFINYDVEFINGITELMEREAQETKEDQIEETLKEIKMAGLAFGIEYQKIYGELQNRLEEYESQDEQEYDHDEDRYRYFDEPKNENEIIDDMFGSLLNDKLE